MSMTATSETLETPAAAGPGFFDVLWRRKSLVIFGLVVGMGVGVLYYLQEAPQYRVTSQLMVLKRRAEPVSISTGGDSRISYVEDYVATQEALIQSHEVLRRAARTLEDGAMLKAPPANGDYIGLIAMGLKVVRSKDMASNANSNILNISYRGTSGPDCPIILNAVINGYRESISGAISSVTDDNLKQIVKGRDEMERRLLENNKEFEQIHEHVRTISPLEIGDLKARINQNESKRSELLARKIELENRLQLLQKGVRDGADRNLLLAVFEGTSPNRKNNVAEQSRPPSQNELLLSLKLQEEELLQRVGPEHPDVLAIQKRRASLNEYVRGQATKLETGSSSGDGLDLYIQFLIKELEINGLQTKNVESLLEEDRALVLKLDGKVVKEAMLSKQGERFRKQLEYLDDRKQQADLTRDAPLLDARVITPAGAGEKVSPVFSQILVLSALFGIVIGFGLTQLAEGLDKNFRSALDVGQRLGLTVIGDVPALTPHEPGEIFDDPLDPLLVVQHLPKSPEAEAFRGVRTSIYFSTRGKAHQVIQVTSPSPSDGKSTVVANLACSIAQSGKKVILIDADFRKPRVHQIFGLSAEVGLASVITGEAKLEAAIQHCSAPGLSILPCGPRPTNPADLLASTLFEDILDEIKKNYDFVLIDSPPMLVVSDPSVVAPRVDAVILAVRLRKNDRPAAMLAKQRLAMVGANILGVVVNGTADGAYGSGSGYNYVYRYQPYGEDATTDTTISRSK